MVANDLGLDDLALTADPAQAVRVMADCYGESAGAEALLRAFLEERDMNLDAARFWLRVYEALRPMAAPPVSRQRSGRA